MVKKSAHALRSSYLFGKTYSLAITYVSLYEGYNFSNHCVPVKESVIRPAFLLVIRWQDAIVRLEIFRQEKIVGRTFGGEEKRKRELAHVPFGAEERSDNVSG